jgi:hypothetical protein
LALHTLRILALSVKLPPHEGVILVLAQCQRGAMRGD